MFLFASADIAVAATFTVSHTNQTGSGSLRQAILDANATPGTNFIHFDITNATRTITPTNALPEVTNPAIIDGATQPGFTNSPIVELNGTSAGAGVDALRLVTSNSLIRGLVINRFGGDGVEVAGAGNTVEGCFLGLNVAGTTDLGNAGNGILVSNAPNNVIGGIFFTQRNVISGNTLNGVLVHGLNSTNNVVRGNYLGLNAGGNGALGNTANGVLISNAPLNTVGGTLVGARNVISGNGQSGVRLENTNAFANLVLGNFIGLDLTGTTNRPNAAQGVYVISAPTNTIGGTTAAARNVIAGNSGAGVRFEGNTARGNVVIGNFFGTQVSGDAAAANSSHGVYFFSTAAHGNIVGGTNSGEPNVIAFNGGDGIYIQAGTNNALRANAVFSNAGLGIDLGADGVTANDNGDPDTGANDLQNFPLLTSAMYSAGGVTITGSLNSRAASSDALDFFANVIPDPSTNGEGQVYLGSTNVTTGANSNVNFIVTFPLVSAGRWISATATDTNGNTSEFSPCVRAESTLAPQMFTVTNTADSGPGSLRKALTDANSAPATSNHVINFAIPGSSVRTVAVFSMLPTVVEPMVIDGFTQSGSSPNSLSAGNNAVWLIRLDGVSAGAGVDGLKLLASSNIVRGLIITRFGGDGIEITNSRNNIIVGNCIGVNEAGASQGNTGDGILVFNSAGNRIGGAAASDRNILSGNSSDGVELNGLASSNNVVLGNYLGPDPTGTLDRRNSANGVFLNGAPNSIIGGAAPGEGNLISRNQSDGVEISGVNATNTVVLGNSIGTDASGTGNLGNLAAGIFVTLNARFNFIGATNNGAGNRIAYNLGDGLYAQTGTNNAIRGNNIWSNSALGIDLDTDGVTANDAGDPDTGANLRQNFPVVTNAVLSTGNTLIEGTLNSRTNSTFFLDFFASFTRDATTTNGEGQVYLGSTTVTTGSDSNAAFNVNLPLTATGGRWITANATDTNGNTSEFSTAFFATTLLPAQTLTVSNTNNTGSGSLREAITLNNLTFNGAPNLINFAIPGPGPHTISPATALPAVNVPVVIDGYTQSGSSSNTLANGVNAVLMIRLDGQSLGSLDGLTLTGPSNTVRGLSIVRFGGDGLELGAGGYNAIEGNFIGLDTDGVTVRSNTAEGIRVNNSPANILGGTMPAARNVISGNQSDGIEFTGAASTNNAVLGNFIGTDAGGTLDRGNASFGVNLGFDTPANTIGGNSAGARNVISGNNSGGVNVFSTRNLIQGNFIGADVAGAQGLANNGDGVFVSASGAGGNLIGGTNAGAGNLIAFNAVIGVRISSGTNNAIRGNVIFSNADLGIDLVSGNANQAAPIITNALITPTNTTVQGALTSRSNTTYQIELFANVFADPSGSGEGQQFLGSTSLTTGADSNGTFSITLPVAAMGGKLTATATDPFGNTSEFSTAFTAASAFPPQTLTVTNTNDSGPGSFRQAILTNNATANGGNNLIAFDIPGPGPHTIAPLTPLPSITRPVTIDGYTQPGATSNTLAAGFNAALKIRLDGTNLTFGSPVHLAFASASNVVRGLVLMRSSYNALELTNSGNVVEGCIIGLDETGVARANNTYGVLVTGAGNRIGGTTPAARNVISRNGAGVVITGAGAVGNRVEGNFIGTDLTGTTNRGNTAGGVTVIGVSNVIGGELAGAGNVISGNGGDNLGVGPGTRDNRIQGNFIGLDVTGTNALGGGVRTSVATNTLIGGTTAAARNVVLNVTIDNLSTGTRVLGNYIGTDATGTAAPVPGGGTGVTIISSYGNTIGGTNSGEPNVIAFANFGGVTVSPGTNNSIRGNVIHSNGGLGIDLINGNNNQPAPMLTNAVANTNSTQISGVVTGAPNANFTLDFYSNPSCDASGFGEGKMWLGSTVAATGAGGSGNFSVTLPLVIVGRVLTTTATDTNGNTSEFSACLSPVINLPPVTLLVTNTNDSGPGSLREALLTVDTALANGTDTIAFNIPGSGVRTLAPVSALPTTLDPVIIDGFTQPGASTNHLPSADNAVRLIQLDGVNAGAFVSGLMFTNPNNVVRGLEIKRFSQRGIELHSDGNLIAGNLVRSNGADGVLINPASNNTIGGLAPAARNVISANGADGVRISTATAVGNVIQGNLIGTDPTGLLRWGNLGSGIALENAVGTLVGGAATGARNVISANGDHGIALTGLATGATTNRILGNYIGTDATGNGGLSNAFAGIAIASGVGSIVGGTNSNEGNRIAFNGTDGVEISGGGTNHAVRANVIFANSGLGIDLLGFSGVNTNDLNDADGGANLLQNFPLLTNALLTTSNLIVQGTLNSRPGTPYRFDFFYNQTSDPSAHGEGETYLGSAAVTTDGSGNASFSTAFAVSVPPGFVTATASDPSGNTSEFALGRELVSIVPPITLTVTNTAESGPGSLRAALDASNNHFSGSNNTIHFNIAGSGVKTIAPLSPLPTVTRSVTINGLSQPGASANTATNRSNNAVLWIRLDGANAGAGGVDGLHFTCGSNVVNGLVIVRFSGDGMHFTGSDGNFISDCFLGLDVPTSASFAKLFNSRSPSRASEGDEAPGNGDHGVNCENCTGSLIRYCIASNNGKSGVAISAGFQDPFAVFSCLFGTDANGTPDQGNGGDGALCTDGASNITFTECTFGDNGGFGSHCSDGASLNTFTECDYLLNDEGGHCNEGALTTGNDCTDCQFGIGDNGERFGNYGDGYVCRDFAYNNTAEDCDAAYNFDDGFSLESGSGNHLSRCRAYENEGENIFVADNANGGFTPATISSSTCSGGQNQIEVTGQGSPNAPAKWDIYQNLTRFEARLYLGTVFDTSDATGFAIANLQKDPAEMISGAELSAVLTWNGNDTTKLSVNNQAVPNCQPAQNQFVSNENQDAPGEDGHPISTFTGELFDPLPADLALGGPLPLAFVRYYGSLLGTDNQITGRLGHNWLHNFEMRLTSTANTVKIVAEAGRVITFTNHAGNLTLTGQRNVPFQLVFMPGSGDYILADPRSQFLYRFNSSGQLIFIQDGRGNTHSLIYSGTNLTSVTDGLGRMLTFQYGATGFLTNVSDGTRSIGFAQAGSNLSSVRDALGLVTTYAYDPTNAKPGLMTSAFRPEGNAPFTQTFSTVGRTGSQTSAGSNTVSLTYTGAVTTLADPLANIRKDTHTSGGLLTAFTDEANQSVLMGYNTNGQRISVADRHNRVTLLGYHAPSGAVAGITNADGTASALGHASRGVGGFTFHDVSQVTNPDGTTDKFGYDASGNVLAVTNRAGKVSRFTYNARGQLLTAVNPLGGGVTNTYHADGTLASTRDSDTGLTTFQYDSLRRLTNVIHPDATSAHLAYDANDRPVSITDERGNTTAFAYDSNNRVTNVTDAVGQSLKYAYDSADRLVRTTDRLGRTMGLVYDTLNHVAAVTNRNGHVTQFGYDARRRLTTITDAGGQVWRLGYDNEAMLTSAANPLNQTNQLGRDKLGFVTRATNALGEVSRLALDTMRRVTNAVDALGRTNAFSYDARGLLASATAPGIGTANYQRNDLGLLSGLTDLDGRQWNFSYTLMGRLLTVGDPLNRTNRMQYDTRGRRNKIIFADGTTRTNMFDAANNLTRAQFSDGLDLQFSHDALDRLTNANEAAFAYDAESRLTNTVSSGVNFGSAFDAGGRLTNVSYANGAFAVSYTYDSRDRLTRVRDSLTGTQLDFNYDNAGRLTGLTRPNGVNGTYTYDAAGRLMRLQEGGILDIQYTLNAADEIASANFTAPLDPANFISGSLSNWTYDAAHQISNAGYSYDPRGRLTASPSNTFSWDGASRLTAINAVTFGYNGLGEIVSRAQGGMTNRYYYHYALGLAPIVAERNGTAGAFHRYYIWSPGGRLLYMIDAANGNAVYHFHFDRVGSTLALTSAAGAVTDAYAYTPYGELLGRTGTNAQPFTFIGAFGVRNEPAANLSHMRARYYDALTARFLSRDPVWPVLGDTHSLDPYQYASGDPTAFIDPTGEVPVQVPYSGQLAEDAELVNAKRMMSFRLGAGLPEGFNADTFTKALLWQSVVSDGGGTDESNPSPGIRPTVKTFVLPHVLEVSDQILNTSYSFDSTLFASYTGALAGNQTTGNPGIGLYLFDQDTGGSMHASEFIRASSAIPIFGGQRASKQTIQVDDLAGSQSFDAAVKLGFGVLVVGGNPGGINLQGFIVNSHTSPFDLSVFGFQPEELVEDPNMGLSMEGSHLLR